jgi:hypothetical protein
MAGPALRCLRSGIASGASTYPRARGVPRRDRRLTEVERKLLLTLGDGEWHPDPVHNVCEVTEGLPALSKLELKHLAARGVVGGYTITRLGAPGGKALVAGTTESEENPKTDG